MRAANLALDFARRTLLFAMAETPACMTACCVRTTTYCLTFAVVHLDVGMILNACSTVFALLLTTVTARQ